MQTEFSLLIRGYVGMVFFVNSHCLCQTRLDDSLKRDGRPRLPGPDGVCQPAPPALCFNHLATVLEPSWSLPRDDLATDPVKSIDFARLPLFCHCQCHPSCSKRLGIFLASLMTPPQEAASLHSGRGWNVLRVFNATAHRRCDACSKTDESCGWQFQGLLPTRCGRCHPRPHIR